MKRLIAAFVLIVVPSLCPAKMVILKDGTSIDAVTVEDKGETIEAVTRFGTLKISRAEIDNLAELGLAAAAPAAGPLTDGLEIITVQNPDGVVRIDYYSGRQKTGTQFFSSSGLLLGSEGTVADGDYREYFQDGKVKREKTVIDGRNNGASKSYYADGTLQNEVYFINGRMNGVFRFYDASGRLREERSYVDGVLNGYSREFNEDASLKSKTLYVNGAPSGDRDVQSAVVPSAPPARPPDPPQTSQLILPAREERPVYRQEPPARSPAAPKAAGILSKPQTFFLAPEVFSIGGANKKWEENFNNTIDYWGLYFDYVSGDMKTYPGYGITAGLNFGEYKDSPGYIAFSYIKGPSAEINIRIIDWSGSGQYNESIETTYMRFVGGYKFVSQMDGNSLFFLDLNGGFAKGKVEGDWSLTAPTGYYSGSGSESWGGITWSASPGIAWEYPTYILEFGARYTMFPKLKDSDTASDISWSPFSLYLNFVF